MFALAVEHGEGGLRGPWGGWGASVEAPSLIAASAAEPVSRGGWGEPGGLEPAWHSVDSQAEPRPPSSRGGDSGLRTDVRRCTGHWGASAASVSHSVELCSSSLQQCPGSCGNGGHAGMGAGTQEQAASALRLGYTFSRNGAVAAARGANLLPLRVLVAGWITAEEGCRKGR